MFTFINSESLWIGTDMNRFNRIREELEKEQVRYKYKVRNRTGQWSGAGTLRGRTGGLGIPAEKMHEYEIIVYKKDFEKASSILNQKHLKDW